MEDQIGLLDSRFSTAMEGEAMTHLAVIIARAGSKGLPGKALRKLDGKPLVAWSIEHALGSGSVDDVVLTSDGQDILDVGRGFSIKTYDRPASRSTDLSTIDDAVRHGVECWEAEHSKQVDHVAILYGNVALRPRDLTDRAMTRLAESGCDSVQTVYPVGKMHPLWMRKLGGPSGDELVNYQPNEIYRRQDLPPVYMLNSGVLAVKRTHLFAVDPAHPHAFLGEDRRAIVTGDLDVIDVDDEFDLAFAETVLRMRRQQQIGAGQTHAA